MRENIMNITMRRPSSPGLILREEFMIPYRLTQAKLAMLTGITRRRINEIINEKRSITTDTALRLGKLFGISPDIWLNLQHKIDLWDALHEETTSQAINKIKPLTNRKNDVVIFPNPK